MKHATSAAPRGIHPPPTSASRAAARTRRAIAYCRCSTTAQEKSIPEQRAEISRYAGREGYEVVEWFEDDGISGSVFKERVGFNWMIDACRRRNGTLDAVLVWDKSRFGRPENPKEAAHYEYLIEQAGKQIVYVQSGRTSDGSLGSAILDTVENAAAGKYLVDLSANVTRHQHTNAKAGFSTGRKPSFGYDLLVMKADGTPRHRVHYVAATGKGKYQKVLTDPTTGKVKDTLGPNARLPRFERTDRSVLVLGDAAEVAVVEEIYRLYLGGRGFKAIAGLLNDRGAPAPNGKRWYTSAVREIVLNPVYRGDLVACRRAEGKFHTVSKDGGATRRTTKPTITRKGKVKVELRDESEWIVARDAHEAIVSREDWDAAQAVRKQRDKGGAGRGRPSVYRLTGLVKCVRCGHNFVGMTQTDRKKVKTRYYVCNGRVSCGRAVCDWNTVAQGKLEGPIVELIKEIYFTTEDEAELAAAVREELAAEYADHGPEIERLRTKVADYDRAIGVLVEQICAHPEHADAFSAKITEKKAEKATIETRIAELEQLRDQDHDLDAAVKGTLSELRRWSGLFELEGAEAVKAQKEVIRRCVKEVRIDYGEKLVTVFFQPVSKILVAATGFEPVTRGL